jgi:hypothetical protein
MKWKWFHLLFYYFFLIIITSLHSTSNSNTVKSKVSRHNIISRCVGFIEDWISLSQSGKGISAGKCCEMSAHTKRNKFLSQDDICELFWDSDSVEEVGASSDSSSSEDEGGFEDQPGVSHLQPDRATSSGHTSSSRWRRGCSEWPMSTGANVIDLGVDMAL